MIYIKRVFPRNAKSTISACEMAHIGVRNGAFHPLKWALSHCEMGNIGKRNQYFRTMVQGIS